MGDCVAKQRAFAPCPSRSNADEKERRLKQENKSEEEGKSRSGPGQVILRFQQKHTNIRQIICNPVKGILHFFYMKGILNSDAS